MIGCGSGRTESAALTAPGLTPHPECCIRCNSAPFQACRVCVPELVRRGVHGLPVAAAQPGGGRGVIEPAAQPEGGSGGGRAR